MEIKKHASLKAFHTFGIEQTCAYLAIVETIDDVIQLFKDEAYLELPKLFLGKGSNMLFTQHYEGMIIINRLMGKTVTEEGAHYLLHIEGGEDCTGACSMVCRTRHGRY